MLCLTLKFTQSKWLHKICYSNGEFSDVGEQYEQYGRLCSPDEDIVEAFLSDFKVLIGLLPKQSSHLWDFKLSLNQNGVGEGYLRLGQILSQHPPINTTQLHLLVSGTRDIMTVLPSIYVKQLQITYNYCRGWETSGTLNLNELVEIEHWRNLEWLRVDDFCVKDVRPLLHLSNVALKMQSITTEEVILLRDAFRRSPNFNHCSIMLSPPLQGMEGNIATPPHEAGGYYKTPDPRKFLYAMVYDCGSLRFDSCNINTLDEDEVLRD